MAITRWDPFSEISRLQSDLNRMWGESPSSSFAPAVDIFEEESAILLKAEVPGMRSEDIHVNIDNGVLSLSGERKLENEEKREGYHRVERRYGSFTRSFVLPKTVDPEAIEADLSDGVLTLRLPKVPAAQPRRIAVKGS
ncbi:MAG: Hsp20/alpha crystallin family protein [Sandaracinaceae bacterium]